MAVMRAILLHPGSFTPANCLLLRSVLSWLDEALVIVHPIIPVLTSSFYSPNLFGPGQGIQEQYYWMAASMGRHITALGKARGSLLMLECNSPNNCQLDADGYCVDGWCGLSMAVTQIMSSLTSEWNPGIKLIYVSDWTMRCSYQNDWGKKQSK